MSRARRRSQAGLTLVELMIAVVISGLVISAALAMGFSMMNGYRNHRAMVLVERSARVSLEIISDAIRNSSPGVRTGIIHDWVGCTANVPAVLLINNTDAPDEIKVMYASGGIFTSTRTAFGDGALTATVLDATVDRGGIAGQDFFIDDYVIVVNPEFNAAVFAQVSNVTNNGPDWDVTVDNTCAPPVAAGTFDPTSLMIRGRYAHFYIEDGASVGGVPTLMMDPDADGPLEPEPLAEGVEDMQIAVAFDDDDDGAIAEDGTDPDDDEWYYNVDGDADPAGITTPRAFRITMVARSTREQSEVDTYARPAAEDRAAATVNDPFRRRVLTTTIELRNMVGSP